ncbi:MAG: YsnF/AvaK domain-containing protein, partial [Pontibacter sp.]|nr:YsnF/AvaK domain-containing protein [Pontibacter sp.]
MKINISKDKVQETEFDKKLSESKAQRQPPSSPVSAPTEKSETIPVVEEQVQIGKKEVETGRVHISKEVHEEQQNLDIPVFHEEVEVERVAINMHVDSAPPPVRYEGDKMIIPVLKEEIVVQKRLVLVEEL